MMLSRWRRAPLPDRALFVGTAVFVALTFAGGGSARADAASLFLVYPAAIALITISLARCADPLALGLRLPILCLVALAVVIALQLLPLPPALWRSLPGREGFASALDLIGMGDDWRPLTLTPDATLSSLMSVLPPLAVLLAASRVPRLVGRLLPLVLLGCATSAALALLQAAGALEPFYRISSIGGAVGLFANRNHQAALLVCTLPLLAAWAVASTSDTSSRKGTQIGWVKPSLALAAVALLLPLLLVTGSRAGLLLGLAAVVSAVVLARPDRAVRGASRKTVFAAGAAIAAVVPAVIAVMLSRDVALQRLLEGSPGDRRVEWAAVFRTMAQDYFPVGSGFGSFEAVFRAYEPYQGLTDTYLNNVHNDLLEIVIEGGLPALIPLGVFVAWYLRSSVTAWRARANANVLARAASVVLAVLLLWSFVDYPLRTPTLAVLAAICCVFLRVDASPYLPVDRLASKSSSARGVFRQSDSA